MLSKILYNIADVIFSKAKWVSKEDNQVVYLTFDDGPHEEITKWVLKQLEKYNAKATFFCLGKNAEKHPLIIEQIRNQEHVIGSHTYSHVNGWKISFEAYKNEIIKGNTNLETKLFRPPYGKLTWKQYRWVSKQYTLVMWSLLSNDYNKAKSPAYCVNKVLSNVKSGDIIVFHDSEKAQKNLFGALPIILATLHQRGFEFGVIK
jgi:peptidoglycan/xylan/chitin deacetylase (PgdA/CDA1 family)